MPEMTKMHVTDLDAQRLNSQERKIRNICTLLESTGMRKETQQK
jgi:hypothetical protein